MNCYRPEDNCNVPRKKEMRILKTSPQGVILLYLPQTDQLLNPKTNKNKIKYFMRADGYFDLFTYWSLRKVAANKKHISETISVS